MIAKFLTCLISLFIFSGCSDDNDVDTSWTVMCKSGSQQTTIGSFQADAPEIPEEIIGQIRKRFNTLDGLTSDYLTLIHTPGPGETWTLGPMWIENKNSSYNVHLGSDGTGTIIATGFNKLSTAADFAALEIARIYRDNRKLSGQQAAPRNR